MKSGYAWACEWYMIGGASIMFRCMQICTEHISILMMISIMITFYVLFPHFVFLSHVFLSLIHELNLDQ